MLFRSLLAAAIEQNHDDKGITWPVPIAPYHVYLCALGIGDAMVAAAAERVYAQLTEMGLEVLFDDRDESAGVKFNDADLLGMPVRVVVSKRTLQTDGAEIKARAEVETAVVPLDQVSKEVALLLR